MYFSLVCGRIRAKDDKEMPMEQIANELTQYFLAHGLIKEDDAGCANTRCTDVFPAPWA